MCVCVCVCACLCLCICVREREGKSECEKVHRAALSFCHHFSSYQLHLLLSTHTLSLCLFISLSVSLSVSLFLSLTISLFFSLSGPLCVQFTSQLTLSVHLVVCPLLVFVYLFIFFIHLNHLVIVGI